MTTGQYCVICCAHRDYVELFFIPAFQQPFSEAHVHVKIAKESSEVEKMGPNGLGMCSRKIRWGKRRETGALPDSERPHLGNVLL
jgi:hypothetical protein